MPMLLSLEQFVERITDSRLISRQEIESFIDSFDEAERPREAKTLASELSLHKLLTDFQTEVLLEGLRLPLLLGNYVILEKIGKGGMGEVFKSVHRRMDRIVAIKILPSLLVNDEKLITRFHREVKVIAQLNHPNIVAAHDADEEKGMHYLVLEYVEGIDLSQVVQEQGALTVSKAIDVLLQAARGMEYAHQQGVIHRDIKPSNLLINSEQNIKVLDMGLARFDESSDKYAGQSELTSTNIMMGTIDYMSPEQAANTRKADARSDIYSLGCTLYYLLTGQSVYRGNNAIQRILAHREHSIPQLRKIRHDVPVKLDTIFQMMIAKEPQDRYQSMTEVINALESCRFNLPEILELSDSNSFVEEIVIKPATSNSSGEVAQKTILMSKEPAADESTLIGRKTDRAKASSIVSLVQKVYQAQMKLPMVILAGIMITVLLTIGLSVLYNPSLETDKAQRAEEMKANNKIEVSSKDKIHIANSSNPENHTSSLSVAWKPGPKEDVIPGFIARPAKINGIKRWQAVSETPNSIIQCLAYSPDQQEIACGCKSGLIRIYKVKPFKLVRILIGHSDRVTSVVYRPDGKQIASASYDKTVRLWSDNGIPEHVLKGHTDQVYSVAYRPDGGQIISGSEDHTIRLWSDEGKSERVLRKHEAGVRCVVYRPDGKQFASGCWDSTVQLWSTDGTPGQTLVGHSGAVWSLAYRPDCLQIASASLDKTVRLWSVEGTPGPILKEHSDFVYSVAYCPDSKQLATGSSDKTVRLWSVDGTLGPTLKGHSDIVWSVTFSPDGKEIASGGSDKTVRLWSNAGDELAVLSQRSNDISSVAYRPDGKQIASGSDDKTVRLWSVDGKPEHVLKGHTDFVRSVAYHPESKQIASASNDHTIRLWSTDGTLETILKSDNGVNSVSYRPDGKQIAGGSDNATICLWTDDGVQEQILSGHTGLVNSVVYHPDGIQIASGSLDKTVRLWSVEGTPGPILKERTGQVFSVAYHPDGKQIASGGEEYSVCLWSEKGILKSILKGHSDAVFSVVYRADGNQFASGSRDKTIRLWSGNGDLQLILHGHTDAVSSIIYCPDGKQIASGSLDGTIRLWNAQTAEAQFTIIPLPDDKAVVFDSSGLMLYGNQFDVSGKMAYAMEYTNGEQKLLSPIEFHNQFINPASNGINH